MYMACYVYGDNQAVLANSRAPDSMLKKKSNSIAYHLFEKDVPEMFGDVHTSKQMITQQISAQSLCLIVRNGLSSARCCVIICMDMLVMLQRV